MSSAPIPAGGPQGSPGPRRAAVAGRGPDPEAVDPATLATLRSIDEAGAPGFFVELVSIFLAELPGRLDTIRGAVARGDGPAVGSAAHSLKGSSANLGARPLATLCERLERDGKTGSLGETGPLLDSIVVEVARVRTRLEQELRRTA